MREEPPPTGLPKSHHQRSMDPCPTDKQRDPEGLLLGMDAAVAAGVPRKLPRRFARWAPQAEAKPEDLCQRAGPLGTRRTPCSMR